jgi:hypothetical protein
MKGIAVIHKQAKLRSMKVNCLIKDLRCCGNCLYYTNAMCHYPGILPDEQDSHLVCDGWKWDKEYFMDRWSKGSGL